MEHTVQNTEGTEVPPQTQRFQTIRENGIIDNPNGPPLYGVKWKKLVFGSPGPEMGAVLHARPDLCFIKQKPLSRREVPLRSVEDSQHFGRQLGFAFQMTPKLDIARNVDPKYPNTLGRLQGYSLELRRHDKGVLLRSERANLCLYRVELNQVQFTPFGDSPQRVLHFRHKF